MNQLNTAKRTQIIAALIEGNSINATCRMLGVGKHTVLRLLKDAGCACAAYHDANVRNLRVKRAQCDEVWSFIYAKQKNVTTEQMEQGAGDCWTWTAIDADTKLIISYMLGDRGASTANDFMQDMASRIRNRIQLTTDGHRVYAEAVENAFGSEIDYAMLVKIYGASNEGESRYSPATCIGCRTGVLAGNPNPKHISTSYVERQNLSMRMGMRRFTRLTNGFSKKFENHAHQVALYFFHYNFCRVHKTLRVTPAMEAGLTDHVWTLEELCGLLANNNPTSRIDKELVLKALRKAA
ncbi:MAG TPA: DDE-type integrase/transposase/recombinase [Terriglobales bacterium]|nr:DDE-type integrase/transposase/recombinase [Terriglobales bacterium]